MNKPNYDYLTLCGPYILGTSNLTYDFARHNIIETDSLGK